MAGSRQLYLGWLVMVLQCLNARRALLLGPSREASYPLFVLLVSLFAELA